MSMSRAVVGVLSVLCFACGGGAVGQGGDGGTDDGGGSDAACADNDGDGVSVCAGDCDDNDPLNSPSGNEICGDGADNDCDQVPDEGCTAGIGTFVSSMTGTPSNPGTQALPVDTIGQGIANAVTIGGPQTVIVAEGTYDEKVTLVEGVDLLGGHECNTTSCTWARDPATHVSTIANTDHEGVLAGSGITLATVIDGFHIVGRDGVPPAQPGSAGITVNGGAPTIRGNTIVGGNVTGGGFAADRSAGVAMMSSNGALIEGNDISGGVSIGESVAIMFDWTGGGTALGTIRGNTLRGGPGRRSVGITAWISAAGTLVSDNDIIAGNSDGGASIGIVVGSAMTIDGNRINVDQATVGTCVNANQWCAGIFSESSTTTITNNVIYGAKGMQSAAIFLGEFEVPAGSVVLNSNYLNGGGVGLGSTTTESAGVVVSIGTCTTCGFNGFVGRVRNNVLDGGNNQNRYGILEDPSAGRSMTPEVIENNLFWFTAATGRTDVMYRQMSAGGTPTDHTTVNAINALLMPPAVMNVTGDPLLDPSWHLMSGSPCINAGTATEAPSIDFEGDPRPAPGGAVDIGHDEF
jgi:hypothetical protein